MNQKTVYDVIGIGIGPFNLGLAALADSIPELKCLFIDEKNGFNWHPGLLLPNARLQVPFYADLVTLADPCSRFSYMAFLKAKQRMFRFAIHENYFVTRKEYNEYGQWVAAQLSSLRFNQTCTAIYHNNEGYEIVTDKERFYARNVVIGIGTVPFIPSCVGKKEKSFILHSGEYLFRKEELLKQPSVTIVGSGQSAAEIFYDLLQYRERFSKGLSWFTRSPRFFPMEYSKLSLELSTPAYIEHFYSLNEDTRKSALTKQNMLYKGINFSLINEIYDLLYMQGLNEDNNPIALHTNCELKDVLVANGNLRLSILHREIQRGFYHECDSLILATGYKNVVPRFLMTLKDVIRLDQDDNYIADRTYSIDDKNSLFIQNAESNTHGFNAADLGLGPYRNAVILNTILKREHFEIEKNSAFQSFGTPPKSYPKDENFSL